jgi:ABC-type transporter Mla MlaB component
MPPTPSFLDRFILHLAANLLGSQKVLLRLDNHEKCSAPLYWRSKLSVDDPSGLLRGQCIDAQLLFVDITFDFVVHGDDDKAPQLLVQLGFFRLNQPTCTYLQTSPLTMAQLEQHAQAVGIDLHSAPPKAMASMMAQELQTPQKPQTLHVEGDEARLSLYYRDVHESGNLLLKISQTTSQFDSLGMSLLFHWNRDLNNNAISDPASTVDKDAAKLQDILELDSKLDRWFQQASKPRDDPKPASPSPTPTTSSKRPAPKVHQYAQLPSKKRRKKVKITYSKPS